MILRIPLFLIALVSCALLSGCGGPTPSTEEAAEAIQGPPRWRLARDGVADGEHALTLSVGTPVRVRLRHEGTDQLPTRQPWRTLAAGQSLRLLWTHRQESADESRDRPGRDDVVAGRTELIAVRTQHHFTDSIVEHVRTARFTRPGKGKLLLAEALPPGRYEDLPPKGSVELLTLVISDVATGEITLRRRENSTIITMPKTLTSGDRFLVWRLFLDIEPLHP